MSIYAPQAVLLTGPARDPFALSRALRPAFAATASDLFHALLARSLTEHLDLTRAGLGASEQSGVLQDRPAGVSVLQHGADVLRVRVRDAAVSSVGSPREDLSVSVTILAHPDRDDALLGLVHTEHTEYLDAALSLAGVQDFAYFSTEVPPVPRGQWDARADVWSRALRDGYSSDLGWRWTLLGDLPELDVPAMATPDLARVLACVPDNDTRARRVAGAMAAELPTAAGASLHSVLRALEVNAEANLPAARAALQPITANDLA